MAVNHLLEELFRDGGDGGGAARRRGGGGAPGGPGALGRKGKRASSKAPERPVTEEELAAVRALADKLGDASKLSAGNVRECIGGGNNAHAIKVRDAVKRERGVLPADEGGTA